MHEYDQWVRSHPNGTLWQSMEWKGFQESLGRQCRLYMTKQNNHIVASALVVIDRTAGGLSTWEIPRGPLVSGQLSADSDQLLEAILADAKKDKCMALYLSPMRQLTTDHCRLTSSHRHIHPEATRILDLTLWEDDLLAHMKQKGRYNIRLAEKHGVEVRQSDDIDAFARLAGQTASRDRFRGHSALHYKTFIQSLPKSFLLLAYAPGDTAEPIAGLIGVVWGATGTYYYGASSNAHRELMAPYLLQWEAMKLCKNQKCTRYDLFGVAPENVADHPWAGVSDFKAKFGGEYIQYPPEQQVVLKPLAKMGLEWKRRVLG